MFSRSTVLAFTLAFAVVLPPSPAIAAREGPRLRGGDVVRFADAEARRRGYRLSEYTRGTPRFFARSELHSAEWIVTYDRKPDANGHVAVGNHFFVHIDDSAKKAAFGYGR